MALGFLILWYSFSSAWRLVTVTTAMQGRLSGSTLRGDLATQGDGPLPEIIEMGGTAPHTAQLGPRPRHCDHLLPVSAR